MHDKEFWKGTIFQGQEFPAASISAPSGRSLFPPDYTYYCAAQGWLRDLSLPIKNDASRFNKGSLYRNFRMLKGYVFYGTSSIGGQLRRDRTILRSPGARSPSNLCPLSQVRLASIIHTWDRVPKPCRYSIQGHVKEQSLR